MSTTSPAQVQAIAKLPLTAKWWKHDRRLQEAKTTPFRSMKEGRDLHTESIRLLQGALFLVDGSVALLAPGSVKYGPFTIPSSEHDPADGKNCEFGPHTRKAVEKFQEQSGLDVDGFAGIMTLRVMDMQLNFVSDP